MYSTTHIAKQVADLHIWDKAMVVAGLLAALLEGFGISWPTFLPGGII